MSRITYPMRQFVGGERKVHIGTEFVKDVKNSGRPVNATGKANVSKVKEIIESDGRYTIRDIAKAICISLSLAQFIQKRILKVRQISTRWIPLLLTDERKKKKERYAYKRTNNCSNVFQSSVKGNLKTLLLVTRHGCTISNQLGNWKQDMAIQTR